MIAAIAMETNRRSTILYVAGLALFVLALCVAQYVVVGTVEDVAEGADLVSISGQQPSLSHRIVLLAQRIDTQAHRPGAQIDADLLVSLEDSVDRMREAHREIMAHVTGAEKSTGYASLTPLFVGEANALDKRVQAFLAQAEQLLLNPVHVRTDSDAVAKLTTMRDGLLTSLGDAAKALDEITRAKLDKLVLIGQLHLPTLGLLICFEVLVIFGPMVRRTRATLQMLVAERERVRHALADRAEIAAIAETASQPIFSFSSTRSLTYRNRAAQVLENDLAPGMLNFNTIFSADFDTALSNGNSLRREVELNRRVYDCMIEPDCERGQVRVYMKDISELRLAQSKTMQGQKLELVGQLTGGIAHDFNNLLMVISGNHQLALRQAEGLRPDTDTVISLLRNSQAAVEKGADLTRSLLAFARRQNLEPAKVSVAGVITELMPLLMNAVGSRVHIDRKQRQDAIPDILIDVAHFQSALLNIFLNARDAISGDGNIYIDIQEMAITTPHLLVNDQIKPGKYVVIVIRDNGAGMPKDVSSRAFEPFFTTKDVGEGTGLGLSMVWGFMKQSKGYINLYSEEGFGTSVKLYFPAVPEASDMPEVDVASAKMGAGEKIMLIDDEDDIRASVRAMLTNLNYRVVDTGDGERALSMLADEGDFDLVLTDVVMPGRISGHEIAERVWSRWSDLPVVMMSGYPGGQDAEDAGCPTITKPYSEIQLSEVICSVLRRKAA